MSAVSGVRYRAHSNTWLAHGYASPGGGAAPAFGSYKPDATTTGYNGQYAAQPFSTLTPYSGNITITTAGTVLQGLDIAGQVIVKAANVTISSCRVRGNSTLSNNSALIDCNNAAVSNCLVEDCLLVPDTPSIWWDGVIGHDYTAQRCEVYNTVDGFGVYNINGANANVTLYGNYVHDLSYFYPDPNHSGGTDPINNGTHNDCMQVQGGANILVEGNNFYGILSTVVGTQPTPRPQSGTIFIVQQNVNAVSNCVIQNNWLDGGQNGAMIRSTNSLGITGITATMVNNRYGHNEYDWGGSLHYYLIRPDTGATVNGVTYPSGATPDAFGNVYDDTGVEVTVRCDLV